MNPRLLFTHLILAISFTWPAQNSFCPPGSQWHFTTKALEGGHPAYRDVVYNKQATYAGKILLEGDSVTVLNHNYFFLWCGGGQHTTFIKEIGDTVFFRSKFTRDEWQILFNFNSSTGDSWPNHLVRDAYSDDSLEFIVTVDSSTTIIENNISLKKLFVKYDVTVGIYVGTYTLTYTSSITERLGGELGIFNFDDLSGGMCDGDYFQKMLCYEDPQFGQRKFSSEPCDYSNLIDIPENKIKSKAIVSPNPTGGLLNISTEGGRAMQIQVTDVSGRLVFTGETNDARAAIDLTREKTGLYILKLTDQDGLGTNFKIIID